MGKIRVKTLGIEETEKKQKQEVKKRKEEKFVSRRRSNLKRLPRLLRLTLRILAMTK